MAESLTVTIGVTGATPASVGYSAGQLVSMSEAFTATNDQLMALTLDVSQMKVLYLHSDVDCTLETNSSSAAAVTLALVAGQPVVWSSTNGQANPFSTVDVTALYVSAAAAGTLTLKALVDPTV